MKISTKGRYGLRAMVDMAANNTDEYIPLNVIAERINISFHYLEQVFILLKKANLVKSVRGFQGGYTLAKKPSQITVGQVLRVLEGDLRITEDIDKTVDKYNSIERSINDIVWEKVNEALNDVIDSITLEQLATTYIARQKNSELDYAI